MLESSAFIKISKFLLYNVWDIMAPWGTSAEICFLSEILLPILTWSNRGGPFCLLSVGVIPYQMLSISVRCVMVVYAFL